MTSELDEIKELINDYYNQNKIAIFVGAGVSALSDFPSWSKLIMSMAKQIDYPITLVNKNGQECLSSDEYLKIPQIYYKTKGPEKYIKYVKSRLHTKKEINDLHKIIMRIRPNHILTTNYDTLLEQASNIAGLSYSVINSDEKVSKAPTTQYILKVHGDFENNNFVLKEDDYLNYETEFKLIDNLAKTIISTHLVIFIGYSLGDYNIKLILNWVKQVQKDSFIEPIFIYTGEKELTEIELQYYKSENIRVIDANKFVNDDEKTLYKEKYIKVMSNLFDSRRADNWFRSEIWIVNHFYKLFESVKDVNYLRIEDVAKFFPGSNIYFHNVLKCGDLKYLNFAYKKREKLSKKRRDQLDGIIDRFYNSGVEAIQDFVGKEGELLNKQIKSSYIIRNNNFAVSYQEVRERIDRYGNDIDSLYSKAYDLYWLGRINDAIEIYCKLLSECYANKRWFIYYFSQINLYYLRQIVMSLNREFSSIPGVFLLGKPTNFWSEEDMKDIVLSQVLSDIPSDIKKYHFLERLLARNYYQDDYVQMYRENYEIDKAIVKQMYTVGGLSKDQVAKIRIFDAVNFIYGNRIAFDRFSEHKTFTKISLQKRFEGMLTQNELASKYQLESNNSYIDYYELLLMIRTFSFDDLMVFYEREKGNQLILNPDSITDFEKYVIDLIDYFRLYFSKKNEGENVIEYITLKDEMVNAIYLSGYYLNEDRCINDCFDFLTNYLICDDIEIDKWKSTFVRLLNLALDKTLIRDTIENDILKIIQFCIDGPEGIVEAYRRRIECEAEIIKQNFPDYKCYSIKEKILISGNRLNSLLPILDSII